MLKAALLVLAMALVSLGPLHAQDSTIVNAGECDPGNVWVPDGGYSCQWLTDDSTGNTEFVCFQTGECQSACFPYECCDENAKLGTNVATKRKKTSGIPPYTKMQYYTPISNPPLAKPKA
jgi:hypothetical protein